MAGPITLLAISSLNAPGPSSRSGSRRSSRHHHHHSDDVDEENCSGGEHDEEEEEEMDEMVDEDERFWAGFHKNHSSGLAHQEADLSERRNEIELAPAVTRDNHGDSPSSTDLSGKIDSPGSSEVEKGSSSVYAAPALPSQPSTSPNRKRKRDLKSLKASLVKREEGQTGFLGTIWHWLIGSKEKAERDAIDEDHPDYIPPKYRWTPILSGLIQPFAILLEIPGLTEHWYVRLDRATNEPVVYQNNPIILDIGLAISMFCAVVANISLISRFMERRIFFSTITCIVALSIHDIINIITVSIFGVIHGIDDGFDYSQAFWMCVCSTAASFFTNCFLIFDLFKTKDFKRSGSGLTLKQRNLVIIVMILLMYIALGALVFNFLIPDIHFQSALYYTIVTIETIGFGDFAPNTLGAKIFLFFYVPLGILNLAVTVGTARDTIVESWSSAYRRRRHEALRRHRERKKQREEEAIRRGALEKQIRSMGAPLYVDIVGGGGRGGVGPGMSKFTLNVGVLSPAQMEQANEEAEGEIARKMGVTSPAAPPSILSAGESGKFNGDSKDVLAEARRMQDELAKESLHNEENYREIQENMAKEEKRENMYKAVFATSLFVVFWVVGASIFSKTEEWDWFQGFYFCFVTFTTIGYGDFAPTSPAGRAFFLIWAILGVATVTLLIAVLVEAYSARYKSALTRRGKRGDLQYRLAAWAHHGVHWKKSDDSPDHHAGVSGDKTGVDEKASVITPEQEELRREAERTKAEKERREKFPLTMLETLSKFHAQIRAFRQAEAEGTKAAESLPDGFKQLLTEYMDEHGMTELEKREVLNDRDTRQAVFWKAYERSLQQLVLLASNQVISQQKTFANLQTLETLTSSFSPVYVGGKGLTRVVTRLPSIRSPTSGDQPKSLVPAITAGVGGFRDRGLRIHTQVLHEDDGDENRRDEAEESGWTSQPDLNLSPVDGRRRRKSLH